MRLNFKKKSLINCPHNVKFSFYITVLLVLTNVSLPIE